MDVNGDWQSNKKLEDSILYMFENEIDTDVTFTFPKYKERVKAHQLILKCRSHVFFVMFSSSLHKPDEDIKITDIEPDVFKAFLEYLYRNFTMVSSENAFQLLYCGHKYQVPGLMKMCTDCLDANMDAENVGLALEQAVLYNEARLKRKCLKFFSLYATESLKNFNQTHLSKDTLEAIVECETINVDEVQIFNICNRWASVECVVQGLDPTGENKRRVLDPIWERIHFCNMTPEGFASSVSPTGLLSMERELEVFRCLNSPKIAASSFISKERKLVDAKANLPERFYKGSSQKSENRVKSGISILTHKAFTILGFVFTQTGEFKVWVNEEVHENVSVPQSGVNVYLKRPLRKAHNLKMVHISTVNEIAEDGAKDECKISWTNSSHTDFSLGLTKHGRKLLPFKSIIFAA